MEMESSRRSAVDRPTRDLGLKKPRLSDEAADRDRSSNGAAADPRDRPFPPRDPRGGGQLLNQRLRERDREEKEETSRGAGAGAGSLQQHQELVAQYKTALAELIFNSKPIITNLTIIAGESLHAAKGIAATICNHILEVPSEQKLPSLYLLDSIVKNIKGDYIRYFAAKLPEVFCKAYKQVDSSIHPGMRHLFGTWKSVFPPATLQIIEKELGFSSTINGSSGAATSKPESQTTQRQPHSIHVNPKYLEARQQQRLQQLSKKTKDASSDDTDGVGDAERNDSAAIVGNAKQWTGSLNKLPNALRQREQLNNPLHEKKGYRDTRDHEFSPEVSGQSLELEVRKVTEKVKERDVLGKPYYGAISDVSETPSSRKNNFDVNQAYGTFQSSGSADADRQLPSALLNTNKSSRPAPSNWENSEEFMWDDKSLRLKEYGGTNSIRKGGWNSNEADKPTNLQRGKWISEHLDSPWNKVDTLSQFRKTPEEEEKPPSFRHIEERLPQTRGQQDTSSRIELETTAAGYSLGRAAPGYHPSALWPPREPPPIVGNLKHVNSRISGQQEGQIISHGSVFSARPGPLSHAILPSEGPFPGSVGTFGQSKQPLQPLSPSAQSHPSSVPIQHQIPHNSADHDNLQSRSFSQMGQNLMQLPGHLNRAPHVPVMRDIFPTVPQGHSERSRALPNSSSSHLQSLSASSASLTQMRHHLPFSQLPQPDLAHQPQAPQLSLQTEKAQPPPLETHITQGYSATSHPNKSFDASGKLSTSDLLAAIMKSGFLPNNPASGLHSQNVQPPLPSGPPPIQTLTSSSPLAIPSSLPFLVPHARTPAPAPSNTRTILPPLPPGPPPTSSQIATALKSSNEASPPLNPLSDLYSSLLATGMISSSPETELSMPTVTLVQMPNKLLNETSTPVSSVSVPGPSTSPTSAILPSSVKELNISEPSAPCPITTTKVDDLIGFDFKPDIIREFHPLVISSLFDDLKHQCSRCGLRFKHPEQLHSHMDWHAVKKSRISNFERVSQSWYADKTNWASGKVVPLVGVSAAFLEELVPSQEKCEEPMVPADENQSICALCGEPFEDFYSDDRDEWMYKGTVYLSSALRQADMGGTDESMGLGLIVHAKCVSSSIDNNMGVVKQNKAGWTDG